MTKYLFAATAVSFWLIAGYYCYAYRRAPSMKWITATKVGIALYLCVCCVFLAVDVQCWLFWLLGD